MTDYGLASADALRIYQRAVAASERAKQQLNNQFGLTASGGIDTSNFAGSIVQGDNQNAADYQHEQYAQNSRGQGTTGLGARGLEAVHRGGLQRQALGLGQAQGSLDNQTYSASGAEKDYLGSLANIASKA